jgi:hypothetical protein
MISPISIALVVISIVLAIYVTVGVVRQRRFDISDAIATIGICLTVLLSFQELNALVSTATPTPTPTVAPPISPAITSVQALTVVSATDFAGPLPTPTPHSYFRDDFGGSELDSAKWSMVNGIVRVRDGRLLLESSSAVFPYVAARNNPFPEKGDFTFTARIRFPTVTHRGVGMVLGVVGSQLPTVRPSSGEQVMGLVMQVWQDQQSGWQILFGSKLERVHYLESPDYLQHVIEMKYHNQQYQIWVDGAWVYTSARMTQRPGELWFGNYLSMTTSENWSSLEVDSILVTIP